MAMIKGKVDDKKFQALVTRLIVALPGQALMNKLGLAAIRLIKRRTRSGVFLEQSAGSETYSEGYKKRRQKLGLPISPVTLTLDEVSGMMSKIDHLVSADFSKVLVYINDPKKRLLAQYHNIKGAGKSKTIRKFMGLADPEEKQLQSLAQVNIKSIVKGLS